MASMDRVQTSGFDYLYSRWVWIFLFLTGFLGSTVLLKFGEIQYLELIDLFQLCLLVCLFIKHRLKVSIYRPSLTLMVLYAIFLSVAFLLCLVAARRQFYFPEGLSLLQHPVWITIARSAEFAIDAGAMLYLVHEFRGGQGTLRFTMKVYFWTGVASTIYSIVTYPLSALRIIALGTYNLDNRMRGFYNEGGPYGDYLISVIFVGVALYYLGWIKRRHLYLVALPIAIAFFNSHSKAAIFALVIIAALNFVMTKGIGRRILILVSFAVFVIVSLQFLDIAGQLRDYRIGVASYERVSRVRFADPNLVAGRVAGTFIVPRMIAAHPFTGIGWGNYATVRNDADYRGASAWNEYVDNPGLGEVGELAEFGIPLTLFLFYCTMYPYLYLGRTGAPLYLKNLALIQPVVYLCGAQMNLTYPWIITAFALSIAYVHRRSAGQQIAPTPYPASSGHALSSTST